MTKAPTPTEIQIQIQGYIHVDVHAGQRSVTYNRTVTLYEFRRVTRHGHSFTATGISRNRNLYRTVGFDSQPKDIP